MLAPASSPRWWVCSSCWCSSCSPCRCCSTCMPARRCRRPLSMPLASWPALTLAGRRHRRARRSWMPAGSWEPMASGPRSTGWWTPRTSASSCGYAIRASYRPCSRRHWGWTRSTAASSCAASGSDEGTARPRGGGSGGRDRGRLLRAARPGARDARGRQRVGRDRRQGGGGRGGAGGDAGFRAGSGGIGSASWPGVPRSGRWWPRDATWRG